MNGGNTLCAVDEKILCVGSCKIEVATLLKKSGEVKVQKGLTGHASLVTQLLPLSSGDTRTKYLISASEDDRFIHAW